DPGERMRQLIDRAIIDPYQRKNKASRDYPRKKQEQAAGPPILRKATRKASSNPLGALGNFAATTLLEICYDKPRFHTSELG
ncbi:MAG: hypothetical protein KKA28_01675, partial [Planctomycetes bacterium]|nr:hypothetical protein [Planctomycetota bacterium]MCG2682162.1 hypothetical protein [Planctomycetales bacterium]